MNTHKTKPKASHMDAVIGQRMRVLREASGLSRANLSEIIGVSQQQLSKYEGGINRISASRLYDIAEVLGASIMDFFPNDGGAGIFETTQRQLCEIQKLKKLIKKLEAAKCETK